MTLLLSLICQPGFPTNSKGKRFIETLIHLLCFFFQNVGFNLRILLTESNKIRLQQRRVNDSIFTTNLSGHGKNSAQNLPRTLVSEDKEGNMCSVRIKLSTQYSLLLIDIISVHIYEQKKQFLLYLSLKMLSCNVCRVR